MPFVVPNHRAVAAPGPPIIRDGLLLRYPCDEGSGSVLTDDSGNGHTANLVNMGPANWVPGFSGTALYFNGTDQHGRNQTIDVTGLAACSICMRIRLEAGWKQNGHLFVFPSTDGSIGNITLHTSSGGNSIIFYVMVTSGYGSVIITPSYDDGNWHSLVGLWSDSVLSLFFDNVESTGALKTGVVRAANGQVFLGDRSIESPNFGRFEGDDFRLYNRVLSASELTDYHNGNG